MVATGLLELTKSDFDWFRRFIEEETGIHILETKYIFLYNRILRRIKELGLNSFSEYQVFLDSRKGRREEKDKLFDEIVISESTFFRYQPQLDIFRSQIFPLLIRRRTEEGHPVKIVCFGCAQGQEPYTLAILAHEDLPLDQRELVWINAVDLSGALIEKAKEGFYANIIMQNVPSLYLDRYFLKEPGGYRLLPRVTRMVRFFQFNMARDNWHQFKYADLIFCRNTIIYFGARMKDRVCRNLTGIIRDKGFLILGHTEIINAAKYGLVHHGANVYRKETV